MMKQLTITKRVWMIVLALLVLPLATMAQGTLVDGHYVDPKQGMEANPTNNPDWSLMKGVTIKKTATGKRNAPIAPATTYGLPDHVNNGANKYFRSPVANQSGNSCGITSRHSHMMAYELNAYRDKDGSLAENMLPAHFAFVPAYREDPNKENYAKYIGVPDGATFGGTNVSTIYGGPYSESSNNYGRMQGYENWHKAMFNRITDNPNFPLGCMTEEGALAWKRWLYNHNGDESFHAGGVIGIGLASSGLDKATIGSTTANDNAGVTGMYYLTHWGTGVDHAMAVVGYDDRIEFDLDGDGTYGSSSNKFGQNETGAWIVANSWGSSWCNNGFIYVPYALGSPTSTSVSKTVGTKTYTGYQAGDANGWTGEIYKIRKDYTPIRTLKAAVAYSKRSEIQICVGISTNLSATSPDKTMVLLNHNYHGDYDSDGTDAEVPMLGQWSDGKLHTEAMEFGYDLTDFTDEFDRHVPLKYFLIINTKSGASGTGQIEYASIMDYELNANGVETPFASKNVTITNNGGTTTISTIVYGEEVCGPDNLTLTSTTLSWDAPAGSSYTPTGYYVYTDGVRIATTTSRTYDIGSATGIFHVTAGLYSNNGAISESPASNLVVTGMSSSSFITYIGEPITSTSALTSGSYVVLKCYGRNKYVYDNGASNIYPITAEGPDILDPDDYKYVFKVTKSSNTYAFQSISGYLPTTSYNMKPSTTAGNYTVALIDGSTNLFSLKSGNYLNGADNNITQYILDDNSKFYIYPVHVSVPSTNTLNVTIANPGTVYANAPVQLSLEGAADIASASWTVAGTAYTGVSPVVTFTSTGSKSVSCTATDSKGNSQTVNTTITVSATPAATANFTLSRESTTGSDRISFISQNTLPGCTYSWSMPGAEETTATTRNASATYLSSGQKTVTLTVTAPNGSSVSHSETFMVNSSAPAGRYSISPAIVVKNNPVTLTDNSLYNPTSWGWRFDSDNNRITYTGQNGTITPTKAGVYKLTFGTRNDLGSDFVEAERALIVCNSASYQGLTLAGGNQSVTATLSSALTTAWTIDFWFNPKDLSAAGITGSKSSNSFTITSAASGVATLTVGSSSVSTDEAFYIANEWHHYAITFARNSSNGTVIFYRDGSVVSTKTLSSVSTFTNYFQNLQLGGSSAPMNGSIDEFRVWSTTLSQANIRSYCVAPISTSTSGLTLYWQMNQSSGTTVNAAKGVTGTLNNFNNAGDAWSDSDGVFALDFSDPSNPTISDSQLNHYYDNVYSVTDEQDGNYHRGSLGLAFDGNNSTYYQSRWEAGGYSSEAGYPHSFILKRGALHEVTAFDIVASSTPTNTLYSNLDASCGRAKYVTIEESDDATNWNIVDKEVRLYDLATNNVILPWPITKEYVRFTFSEPLYTDKAYAALVINEMNFYGTAVEPVMTEVPLSYVACSDESTKSDDLKPGSNALDGDESTFWHSEWYPSATSYPHSITFSNLPEGKIDLFRFYQQHSYSGNQTGEYRAGVMNVETSSNGSTWTTAFEGLRIPYGADGYVKLPSTIDAKYIRLTFTRNETTVKGSSNDNGTFLAMNEIEAYGVQREVAVTWKLLDTEGATRATINKNYTAGNAVSEYPDELKAWEEKYVQLEALSSFTPNADMVKEVHCTYNTPFTISSANEANYYYLRFLRAAARSSSNCMIEYLSSSDLDESGALMMTQFATPPTNNSDNYKYQWAFFGNPFDGFTIKNRAVVGAMHDNNQLQDGGIPVMSESNSTNWTILLGKHYNTTDTYKDNINAAMADGTMCISKDDWYWTNYGFSDKLKESNGGQEHWLTQIIPTFVESVNMVPYTITWNVVDENDNVLYTVDKTYTTGTQVTEYPTELTEWAAQYEDRFVALPSLTSFTVTADGVKEVPYEWTGPFQLTTDVNNPSLYHLRSARYSYYVHAPYQGEVGGTFAHNGTLNATSARDAWFFTGDPFGGIEVHTYTNPTEGLSSTWTLAATPSKLIPRSAPDITTNYWSDALSSAAFGLVVPGTVETERNSCLSESGVMWSASSITTDKGCCWVVEAVDVDEIVKSGYYRIHSAAEGYTDIYMSVDEENNAMCNNRKYDKSTDMQYTAFSVEEQSDYTFHISKNGYYLKGANSATTNSEEAANCNIAYNSTYNAFTIQIASGSSGYANIDTWSTDLAAWSIEARSTWIIEPMVSVTLNTVGDNSYATFYYDRDVQTDANTKAYYITEVANEYAQLTEVGNEGHNIPAYTAVVLVNSAKANSALFEVTSGFSSVVSKDANLLKGTLISMTLDLSDDTNYYSMGRKDGKIGFYKFDNNDEYTIQLGANKAYLEYAFPNSIKGFILDFDDITGIKAIDGGQRTMDGAGEVYDLSGRRVSKPVHGIYIKNGKKVLVK